VGKGLGRVNIVQTLYINGKMRPVKTIPGMAGNGGGIKENNRGVEFKYNIFNIL
jgi:hypothetical protein